MEALSTCRHSNLRCGAGSGEISVLLIRVLLKIQVLMPLLVLKVALQKAA